MQAIQGELARPASSNSVLAYHWAGQRFRLTSLLRSAFSCLLVIVFFSTVFKFFWWLSSKVAHISSLSQMIQEVIKPIYWAQLGLLPFWWSPFVLFFFPLVLLLTILFSADRSQVVFSRGFFQDMAWSLAKTTFVGLLLIAYVSFLKTVLRPYYESMTFSQPDIGYGWRFFLTFLASDFLHWLRHVILHKVPVLWHFHAVHHSQRQLNPFSIDRVHPFELLFTISLWFFPMLVITSSLNVAADYYFFHYVFLRAQDVIVHSNIKINFGIFRFLLVTPQSHRIHHAIDTRYHDTNFGAILSVWDWLFRTQHRDHETYPATGISDPAFPDERRSKNFLQNLIGQLLYPFAKIFGAAASAVRRTKSSGVVEQGGLGLVRRQGGAL